MADLVTSLRRALRTGGKRTTLVLFVLVLGGAGAGIGLDARSSPRVVHTERPTTALPRLSRPAATVAPAYRPPAVPPGPPHAADALPAPYRLPADLPPTALIAALTTTTAAYRSPGGAPVSPIAPTWHGSPLFLPVIDSRAGDLEVELPTRPNGSTTWIRSAAVRLSRTPYRIVIDLATRHLFLYRDGKLLLDAPAGIGTAADPTPTGQFFVAFLAAAPSPAWGSFVLVTSAHSEAISDWEESGDALVAIHGPLGDDAEIGTTGARISHGCIRLHDADLAQLRVVPDGSPVDIIA